MLRLNNDVKRMFLTLMCLIFLQYLFAEVRVYIEQPAYTIISEDVTLPVMISGLDQSIRGFSIDFSFDTTYLNIHNYDDFQEGTFLSNSGPTQLYVTGADGQYNVTCSLLGISTDSDISGVLFTVILTPHGVSTGLAGTDITLTDIILRGPLNQTVLVDIIDNTNVVINETPAYANFTIFLQGSYVSGGSMTHSLSANIPLVSPYDGEVISALPDVSPNYIVDWVNVQLRTGIANSTTVQSANAFLLQNGSLVDVLGNRSLPFYSTAGNEYYIVIKHRNHLAIMSSVPHAFSNNPASVPSINLSVSGSVYGGDILGFKQVETGVYALYAGDADRNGVVEPIDSNNYWRLQVGLGGYYSADFNLDGQVQPLDLNNYWRLNPGLQSQVPQ